MPDQPHDGHRDASGDVEAGLVRLAADGGSHVLIVGATSHYPAALVDRHITAVVSHDGDQVDSLRRQDVEGVIEADVTGNEWVETLHERRFDVVILDSVLDEAHDPEGLLDAIRSAELVADSGYLVVSVRNAAQQAVRRLLAGHLPWRDAERAAALGSGFTDRGLQELCERRGYLLTRLERLRPHADAPVAAHDERFAAALVRAFDEAGIDSQSGVYLARLDPVTPSNRLSQLHDELERERVRLRELAEDLRQERARGEALASALQSTRADLERLRADPRHGTDLAWRRRLSRQLEQSRKEQERLAQKLADVYSSETWKVGTAALWLPRKVSGLATRVRRRSRPDNEARDGSGPGSRTRRRTASSYKLEENRDLRAAYEQAVAKRGFSGDGVRMAVAVYTLDFDEGRGDIYTAVGLGRYLERMGYEVVYLPRDEWYAPPPGTDVYLSLLAEQGLHVDPLQIPEDCAIVGWVRNSAQRWKNIPTLGLYDALLCSSMPMLEELRQVFSGPCGLLPIGVDDELFRPGSEAARQGVVATANQWGKKREAYRQLARCSIDFPFEIHAHVRDLSPELSAYHVGTASFFALPSLYRQAAVVLDDLQDVNRSYGSLNSRLYESLACDAVPVTNTRVGLEDAGLEDVPVFTDGDSLVDRVHDLLGRPEERDALAARLRGVVLERHTYAVRARELDAFLSEHDLRRSPTRPTRTVVGFYPDYRSTNPYQDMLYSTAADGDVTVVPADVALRVTDAPVLRGSTFVLNLHWTAPILGPAETKGQAVAAAEDFVEAVDALKANGGRVVWTLHNVLPHECRFPEVESRLQQAIAERADAIHVMCPETPELVEPHYTLPRERVRVIPHASYVDVYPNVIDEGDARAGFGLDPTDTVFLFFGGIRPYKGLEDLLDAFEIVAAAKPESRLLVGGRPGRFPEVKDLERRCRDHPQIVASFEAVDDVDVQRYFNAADVVVLPYRQVLNSGAVLLAFSFGRPVVAPRIGCLPGLLSPEVGIGYQPGLDDLAEPLPQAAG
jgi:glycosyltransferase involved in cell wall biosynthesis